jgi:RNA polymerase sigma factor (sigma-70 family)
MEPSPSPTFDPLTLTSHVDFVRRLARGLVRGASDAADAADELAANTLAAAVAQRPQTGASFRGWLRRVATRLRRREVVADARRLAREREHALASGNLPSTSSASSPASPPADELVAQMELTREVAAAFASLDEPYKSTLFRRYFHDTTPTQIAADTATPLATVKSRLQRGLDQLRARLDAKHRGSREQWLAALVPWIQVGAPIVATKSKLVPVAVAAAVLAGATIGGVEVWRHTADRSRDSTKVAAAVVETGTRGGTTADATSDGGASTNRGVDARRTPIGSAAATLPFASGTVVDERGAPLADVAVVATRLRRETYNDQFEQEPLRLDRLDRDRLTTSDATGRFTVVEPGVDLVSLCFVRAGFAVEEWSELAADRAQNQEHRVVLQTGARFRGVCVDTSHQPIASVLVQLAPKSAGTGVPPKRVARHLPDTPEFLAFRGLQKHTTDARGAFDFGSLASRDVHVSCMAYGYAWTQLEGAAASDPCEVVMPREAVIVDVVDLDTQLPLRAAMVAANAATGVLLQQVVPWAPGDVDHSVVAPPGRLCLDVGFHQSYRAVPLWLEQAKDHRATVRLHVLADGYVGQTLETTLTTDDEPPQLRVELEPAAGTSREPSIAGHVGGATHATLSAYALIPNWSDDYLENRAPLLAVPCKDDGAFELYDLPKGRYRLRANAAGRAPAWTEVEAPASGVALELAPASSLEVTVHDHTGRPAKGVVVHAQPFDESAKHAWSTRANDDGVATLEGMPAGRYRVGAFEDLRYDLADATVVFAIQKSEFPDADAVETKPGECTKVARAVVERLPVRFHCQRDDGAPVTDVKFEFVGLDGPVLAAYREFEAMRHFRLELDAHGDARIDLYPGHYVFRVFESTVKRELAFDVAQRDDNSVDVRLPSLGPTATLSGRLVELGSGAVIAKRKVFGSLVVDGAKPVELGIRVADERGEFRFDDVPAGTVRLVVAGGSLADNFAWREPDPTSPYGDAEHVCHVELGHENRVEIALPPIRSDPPRFDTVEFDATVTDTSGHVLEGAALQLEVQSGATTFEVADLRTDERGHAKSRVYAAEKYLLAVYGPFDHAAPAGSWYLSQPRKEFTPKEGVLHLDVALEKRK